MFRRTPTSRGRGGGGGGGRSNYSKNDWRGNQKTGEAKRRGGFLNGSWHCDCDPPAPAEHFRVKKDGPNHGRWFYTCQAAQDKRCGFFLWDEDAKPREEAAVLAGRRTEPGREDDAAAVAKGDGQEGEQGGQGAQAVLGNGRPTVREGDGDANPIWAQRQSQTQTQTQPSQPRMTGVKRKHEEDGRQATSRKKEVIELDGSETEGPDEFDDGDEDELLSWPPTAQLQLVTPSKRAKMDHGPETPRTTGRKLPWLDYSDTDPKTPSKSAASMVDMAPGKGTVQLPTPSRTKEDRDATDANTTDAGLPSAAATSPTKTSLREEVLAVLGAHMTVPERVRVELAPVLSRHELKLQGVVKGRDLVRAALRAKEARVVELQGRIAGLEADREVLLAAVRGAAAGDGVEPG